MRCAVSSRRRSGTSKAKAKTKANAKHGLSDAVDGKAQVTSPARLE